MGREPARAGRDFGDAMPNLQLWRRRLARAPGASWQVIKTMFTSCFQYRVTGLAAETAFFAMLSIPPLIFGLSGAIGFIAGSFDPHAVDGFQEAVLTIAARFLTPESISGVVAPMLDSVLSAGRIDVISIGFLIALWSGSRTMAVLVDTVSIMYGRLGNRGLVRSTALSFLMYVVGVVTGAILLPLVLAGPRWIDEWVPHPLVRALYWPGVLALTTAMLATLFDLCVGIRKRHWRSDLPGAVVTLLIWLGGSAALKSVLVNTFNAQSFYGPLSAPIAVLLWLYVMALAVLIGASLNAAIQQRWPQFSGIDPSQAAQMLPPNPRIAFAFRARRPRARKPHRRPDGEQAPDGRPTNET